jgi:cytochrome c oxidase cbb3-type subunit 3
VTEKRDELLSHEADGIREFDNALPRWWLYGFYVTIVVAVAYFTNYHVLSTPLVGRSTLAAEYDDAVRLAALTPRTMRAVDASMTALSDAASLDKGRAIFEGQTNVCFSCHRADLGGLVGPNLTDDYWIHGCTAAQLVANIKSGFPEKGMMPFGSGQHLSDEEVLQVASYVLSKRDTHPPNPKAREEDREKRCGPNGKTDADDARDADDHHDADDHDHDHDLAH